MNATKRVLLRLPGGIASILMIFFTVMWTYWGVAEMYHEGWWGAWFNRLPYLVPIAVTLIPSLLAFRWPLVGGTLIVGVGVFAFFFFGSAVAWIGLGIALVGAGFLVDGVVQRKLPQEEASQERTSGARAGSGPRWWRWWRSQWQRHWRSRWRYWCLLGLSLIVVVGVSAYMLPIVLTRVDDGDRSARLIEGHGVTLIWAPEGPGWNWRQPWGGYPSWQSVALYGVSPVGLGDKPGYGRTGDGYEDAVFATEADMAQTNLCRYLNAEGTVLLATPQDIWRMPTTDEVVRSLVRHGANAGCAWAGAIRQQAPCDVQPDKESPLWATDHPSIYYWTADAYSEERGYFVAYNGMVNAAYKLGGNPRHSYRCVKEP